MTPVQEANNDNLGILFFDEAILMSTHNIQFYGKIRKFP